jgi:hypothetical protein
VDRITRRELEGLRVGWDAAVDALAGPPFASVDPYCASSDWMLPVLDTWGEPDETVILTDGTRTAVLAPVVLDSGHLALMGPDVVWSYAPAIVGPTPGDVDGRAVAGALRAAVEIDASYLVLPGLVPGSPLEQAVGEALQGHVEVVGAGLAVERCQADLPGEPDAFLAARSPRFRRNLRRAERAAERDGITFEILDDAPVASLLERVIGVEARSWKGRDGSGLLGDRMGEGFSAMVTRLHHDGRSRAVIARHEGRDVGFILGGVHGSVYRGLQISYDQDYRDASIGHLLQWHEVRRCIADHLSTYDLGMPLDYKEQWSDRRFVTRALVVRPELRRTERGGRR